MFGDSPLSLLTQPYIAAVLGVSLGVGLLFVSRASFRGMTAEDPTRGLLVAGISMILRLFFSVFVLWVYRAVASDGFLYFALAFMAGFLVTYTVELVRFAGLHRYARPNPGAGIGGR